MQLIGICENIASFNGYFDGRGHIISGLYIGTIDYLDCGLFSIINNAIIKNLTVQGDISIQAKISEDDNAAAAGIVFVADGISYITNCVNEVNVSKSYKGRECAGIVGCNIGTELYIEKCVNKGRISGGHNCGGLIGSTYGDLYIIDSYNEGEISNTIGDQVGGLLGRGDATKLKIIDIKNSYNIGNVNGRRFVGGLIGRILWDNVTIDNCYNTGKITSNGKTGLAYLGGLIGRGTSQINKVGNITITNSYNVSAIIEEKEGNYDVVCGGIVGESCLENTTLINCYSIGDIIGGYSGGIIGLISCPSNELGRTQYVNVLNTYCVGNVSGRLYTSGILRFHVEGIISNIKNVYYLSSSADKGIDGYVVEDTTTPMLESEILSENFVNILNDNLSNIDLNINCNKWKYNNGSYPTF